MLFGRDLSCPFDVISRFTFKNRVPRCPVNYVEWVKQTINITYKISNQNLQKAALCQKKIYDRGVKPRSFDPGDFVWRWYPQKADQDGLLNPLDVIYWTSWDPVLKSKPRDYIKWTT
jgi:hypothetical protein